MLIDSHTHMPSPGWPGHNCYFKSVEEAVKYLRETGTDVALFNTWQGVFAETEDDLNTANQVALDLFEQYQGFLYPGAVIHPAFPELSKAWLDNFRNAGFLWVGELVPYKCNTPFDDPLWMKLFEYCESHGHVIQLHNSSGIAEVAKAFPTMQVVCSHIGSLEEFAGYDNIWLDLSGGNGGLHIGAMESAYEHFGDKRLLYGTDFTGYEPRAFQERAKQVFKSDEAYKNVCYQNIIDLIDKVGSRPLL